LLLAHGDPTRNMSQGREQHAAGFELAPESRVVPESQNAPTQQLGLAAVGDRCANCNAPLSSDQRYCINCGERRGKPRFALAEPSAAASAASRAPSGPRAPRRPRASAGFTLIAGIATLLLAMGVGVLIGHTDSPRQSSGASQPLKIDLSGASSGASSATTTSAASATTGAAKGSSAKSSKHGKASKSKPNAASASKASSAATKVTGGSAKVAPSTVTQGSSCTSGQAGCSGGKFSGSFFGN
jgi:hypothetical protein